MEEIISEKNTDVEKSTISWISASKIDVSPSEIETPYEPHDYTENTIFPGCKLKLLRSEKALTDLKKENLQCILEAESQHSDLIPAKYEVAVRTNNSYGRNMTGGLPYLMLRKGGLKIWECSYDLGQYILENDIELEDKIVLDLGCGAGVVGLIALTKNSTVNFQDYNVEVIKSVTIPNVLLNFEDRESTIKKCEFYSGDWESFTTLSIDDGEVKNYDIIFTSETIYNPDNHRKLYDVFKHRLKSDGIGFIAGKSYYFGVGGGMRQFQSLIEEDGFFDVAVVWKTREGLQREILKVTRKHIS